MSRLNGEVGCGATNGRPQRHWSGARPLGYNKWPHPVNRRSLLVNHSLSHIRGHQHSKNREVSRLFSLYARPNVKPVGNLRRSIPPKPMKKSTCIHNFFRLNGWRDDEVPKLSHQAELEQGGLGERKIVFSDKHCTAGEFEAQLQKEFPKLKDGGCFHLLLEIIPCLAEKYTPKYLESYGIHKATVCVGLLQQYLSLDKIN
ncbi:hypothetical protein AOLI_G00147690 [Acnodon oligacanthus]